MGTLQNKRFSKILVYSMVFGAALAVLTYLLVISTGKVSRNSDINPSDIQALFLEETDLNPTVADIKDEAFPTNSSSDLSNGSSENIQITTVKPYENETNSIGFGSVKSNRYEFLEPGTYKINKVESLASALVFMWENGTLFVGNSEQELDPLPPTTDEYATDHKYMSELVYSLNEAFYVKVTEPTIVKIDTLSTATISEESLAKSLEIENKDSGAKYSTLPIISRDNWGASTSSWDPYSHTDIDDPSRFTWDPGYFRVSKIIVHHTASPNTADDPARAVRDIYLYHAYSRGWGDIGYHYLIDRWGNIYEGKAGGDEVFGYHAYTEANQMGLAISLIGNFENEYPTEAQKDSLAKLIAEKSVFYDFSLQAGNGSQASWTSQNITVYGHKESYFWCHSGHSLSYLCPTGDKWVRNNTACPGTHLGSILASEIVPRADIYATFGFEDIKQAVNKTALALESTPEDLKEFLVTYNLPTNTDSSTIESKIPNHSGIKDFNVYQNRVTIRVDDWNNGVIVPTVGWSGSPSGTFFPASAGPKDRIETLMKIFMLDPDVKSVGVMNRYTISPIE